MELFSDIIIIGTILLSLDSWSAGELRGSIFFDKFIKDT